MKTAWKQRNGTYSSLEELLLSRSGQTQEQLLHPVSCDPSDILGMPEAAALLRECLREGRPVVIVGDYDVDGVTSSAILTLLLEQLGCTPRVIIPKRFSDGYGISERLIADISDSLILTVDNGIAAVEPIRRAREQGNRVIVLDHHLPNQELPPADVLVDPHIEPERNPFSDYCGAGLALKLAELLLTVKEHRTLFYNLNVLAALGTVADSVPILGDNRRIVRDGLQIANHAGARSTLTSGLQQLLEVVGLPCDEETISFQLAPMLNAVGRLYNAGAMSALKALLCRDANAPVYAGKLREINEERKRIVAQWLDRCIALGNSEKQVQLLYLPEIPEGIVGILAGRLTEVFRCPAILFTDSSTPGILKGSGRSYEDFDLSPLTEVLRPMTVACGGHTGAAGLSIEAARLEEVRNAAEAFMAVQDLGPDRFCTRYDLAVSAEELPEVYRILKEYAPYGEGLPRPLLLLRDFRPVERYGTRWRLMGAAKNHIRFNGDGFEAVGFGYAEEFSRAGSPAALDLLGTLGENSFNGRTTLQFKLSDLSPAGPY